MFTGKRSFNNCLPACSVQYGVPLEKVVYQFSTADFVYTVLFGMVSLLVCIPPAHAVPLLVCPEMPVFTKDALYLFWQSGSEGLLCIILSRFEHHIDMNRN